MIGRIRHFFDHVAQIGKILEEPADATGGVGLLCERGAAIDGHLQEGAQSLFGLFVSHSIAF
jgi:hypothetical protein